MTARANLNFVGATVTDDVPNDATVVTIMAGGDMLKADNLSGLADNATARTNIGLGATDNVNFG